MKDDQANWLKLRHFISVFREIDEAEISPSSCLENDLVIYGDDATELFVKYSKEFQVDLSELYLDKYFSGEDGIVFGFISWITTGKAAKSKRPQITVDHLLKGIQAGRLNDEILWG